MIEYIGWFLYHIFRTIIFETLLMGLFRLLTWPGLRIYSFFTKESAKPVRELRKKEGFVIWPFVITIIFWWLVFYFIS